MAGDLVLITGATGLVGFRTLVLALEKGYQARIVIRKQENEDTIASCLPSDIPKSQYSFVVVPDFLKAGAFDEPVKGVKYIIHVASPLPGRTVTPEEYERHYIQTAVQGTTSALEAARKAGGVERIVVTSSAVALIPLEAGFDPANKLDLLVTAESRVPERSPPFPYDQAAYAASKISALNRTEAWVQQHKPAFDVIHIHPSFIFGRNGLAKTPAQCFEGTNALMLSIAIGQPVPVPALPNSYCHVDDVARVHVGSLDPKVKGNQSFLVSSDGQDGMTWEDVSAIVAKRYPQQLDQGVFKKGEPPRSVVLKADVSKTEQTFGFKHASLEEVVTSVVDHYVELVDKEAKA